jgi:hypothetical protein
MRETGAHSQAPRGPFPSDPIVRGFPESHVAPRARFVIETQQRPQTPVSFSPWRHDLEGVARVRPRDSATC